MCRIAPPFCFLRSPVNTTAENIFIIWWPPDNMLWPPDSDDYIAIWWPQHII